MGTITVLGVGLEREQMTFAAAEALRGGKRVILHTDRIGCADYLREAGIGFESLDALYDSCPDFDEHAAKAAESIINAAADSDVIYAVYDVRDRSVLKLLELAPKTRVIAGVPAEGALLAKLDGETAMFEASDWQNFHLSAQQNALVREIASRELASEVKLKLMSCYPEESRAYILNGDDGVSRLPLYDLDRMRAYDHRTCALVPAQRDLMKLERYGFDELVRIMRILQSPQGCAWDRVQTHESLRPYLIEECYEAVDAINEGDPDHLYDELGDLLMQVVMHAVIAEKHGEFEISDSLTAICQKMISRHTHIFGTDHVDAPEEVLDLWAKNKMKERGQERYAETLREVLRSFPALKRTCKLLDKAARAGVKTEDLEALRGEIAAVARTAGAEKEIGDLLLLVCALARGNGTDAELALNEAADRFVQRFEALENALEQEGDPLPAQGNCVEKCWKRVIF